MIGVAVVAAVVSAVTGGNSASGQRVAQRHLCPFRRPDHAAHAVLPLNGQHLVSDLAAGLGIQSEPCEHRGHLNVAGSGQQGFVVGGPGLAEATRRDDPGGEGLRGGVGRLTASAATISGDEFGG
jgi:hypothetical protein